MPFVKSTHKWVWLRPALNYGFGVTAALANNVVAILCALSWYAVPREGVDNLAGFVMLGFVFLAWGLSIIDFFRPSTWRYWVRVALIPIGALLNFLPLFVYSGLANVITGKLGNGPP